jgi:hypothetical protein
VVAPAIQRTQIPPPAQIQVPGPRLSAAGLAEADDDATTTDIPAVREPVMAPVGSPGEAAPHPAARDSGRPALGTPAAPAARRGRGARGSHRAARSGSGRARSGRSSSGHHAARPAG